MDAPAYRKPTHQYGQPFGTSPETADDENWAGKNFPKPRDPVNPEVLEPVDQPA